MSTDNAIKRFELARRLGPLAMIRLRAEILLEYADNGTIPLADAERNELDRIAVVPSADDLPFLASFDRYLTDDERGASW